MKQGEMLNLQMQESMRGRDKGKNRSNSYEKR